MISDKHNVQCPNCNISISIDDVLTHQIESDIKCRLNSEQKEKEQALLNRETEVTRRNTELLERQKKIDSVISEKVASILSVEKINLIKNTRAETEKEQNERLLMLEEQLAVKNNKLEQAIKTEIEFRKEKFKLEEEKSVFELEKMRQLEEAKVLIIQEANTKAAEDQKYNMAQLEKKLSDVLKVNQDLTRKLEQGSQQIQGEVLELELEETLKREFLFDEIIPVPTGIKGADIIQKVKDRSGRLSGQIVWETKRTKSWNEHWIQKLKDDQRAIKADIAVIVSEALPEEIKGFIFRDGVWICDIKLITPLATALRINLEMIMREKAMAVGKNEKMDVLYSYLTGVEFKQRVEAIVEAFNNMEDGLKKERKVYEKLWAEREKQLKRVINNTIGMYGDLNGLIALPSIKSFELETLCDEIGD